MANEFDKWLDRAVAEWKPEENHHIPPGFARIGTCSLCGGDVICASPWMGVMPPPTRCLSCGAKPDKAKDDVIPMTTEAR